MKASVISSSHHYYVIFFHANKVNSVTDIVRMFNDPVEKEEITIKSKKFLHIQVLINRRYGSENALIGNIVKLKGNVSYWYDMYMGKIDIGSRKGFFIAYPYFKLRDYIKDIFTNLAVHPIFFKPKLVDVMNYMKGEDRSAANSPEIGWKAEIVKYSAAIKDSGEASKINLSGQNPLNSRAYDVLSQTPGLTVTTTALKLRCVKTDIGNMEISFDKLGNYRFWIKRESEAEAVLLLPYAFSFFHDISALSEDDYIGNQTLLEDE